MYPDLLVDLSDALITVLCFYNTILNEFEYVGHGKCIYSDLALEFQKHDIYQRLIHKVALPMGMRENQAKCISPFHVFLTLNLFTFFIQLWRDQWCTGINCRVGLGKINWVK